MNCTKAIEVYVSLDQKEALPVNIKLHCMRCTKCKRLIGYMERSIANQQQNISAPTMLDDALLRATMHRIACLPVPQTAASAHKSNYSFYSWLIAGILLIAGFVIIPLSEIGQKGLEQFGTNFNIAFALLCAGSVSGYTAMFLIRNLAFFSTKIHSRTSLR